MESCRRVKKRTSSTTIIKSFECKTNCSNIKMPKDMEMAYCTCTLTPYLLVPALPWFAPS